MSRWAGPSRVTNSLDAAKAAFRAAWERGAMMHVIAAARIEPRNRYVAEAETVHMVERNMCDAVMRGIVVPPGSKSTRLGPKGMTRTVLRNLGFGPCVVSWGLRPLHFDTGGRIVL